MKTIGFLILDALVYGGPAIILLVHLLHGLLPRQLDKIWFNNNFFSVNELAVYSSYPMSLVRTLGYSAAIGLPFIMKKRFHDLSPTNNIGSFEKFLVYIFFMTVFIVLSAGLFVIIASFIL